MRQPNYTTQFERDLRLQERRGKDLTKLKEVLAALINEEVLAERYRDHPLRGNFKNRRELAVRGPYDLMAFPAATTCLASYGANPPALAALAAVLRGERKPGGRLPVDLPGLYPAGAGLADFVR